MGLSMTRSRRFMLRRPGSRTSGPAWDTRPDERPGSLAAVGPTRRGPPLPPHERRVLLPLGADRAMGDDAAADAELPLVSRRHLWPRVARERRARRHFAPAGRPRARTARQRACPS